MRYLFCFPREGFNDICNVIWICYNYCKKYDRILVIDTRNINTMKDDIRKYIIFKDNKTVYGGNIDELYESLKKSDRTFLPDIRHIPYENIYDAIDPKHMRKCFSANPYFLSINRNYDEDILFYSRAGSGNGIVNMLKEVDLNKELREYIITKRKMLPKEYISLHVRNTDYKTNISYYLNKNEEKFLGKDIFLGSDNRNSVDEITDFFEKKSRIYFFSNIPYNDNKPLHNTYDFKDRKEYIYDIITDIFLLSLGNEFYYTCELSWFSKNIVEIRKNINIIEDLLNL